MAIDATFARHKEREIKAHQGKVGFTPYSVPGDGQLQHIAMQFRVSALVRSARPWLVQRVCTCMQVYCLGWDCEGQKLASASADKTVRVWNIEHRHKVLPISVHAIRPVRRILQFSCPARSSTMPVWVMVERTAFAVQFACVSASFHLEEKRRCRRKTSGMRANSSIPPVCTACIGTRAAQRSW